MKERISRKIKEESLKLLYKKKCSALDVSVDLVLTLLNQNCIDIRPLLKKSKTKNSFTQQIKECIDMQEKDDFLTFSLLMGTLTGIYKSYGYHSLKKNEIKNFIEQDFTEEEFSKIVEEYESDLYLYIVNHNSLKNEFLLRSEEKDLTKDFTEEEFLDIVKKITEKDFSHIKNEEEVSYLFLSLCMQYSKKELLEEKDFVHFEIENDSFIGQERRLKISTNTKEDRKKEFYMLRNMDNDSISKWKNLGILEKRVRTLDPEIKETLLTKIEEIKKEENIDHKIELLQDVYSQYEIEMRKQVIGALYTVQNSKVITDFRELKPIMIHTFLRDANAPLQDALHIKKMEITGGIDRPLTVEEEVYMKQYSDYLENTLLNPTITHKGLLQNTYHSDPTGFTWYKSNTQEQLSFSIFDEKQILKQKTSYGVGFDQNGLNIESIATLSNRYITSNKGIYNLETENDFKELSSPLTEVKTSSRSEGLLFRTGMDFDTKASYVFGFLDGSNKEFDERIKEEVKRIAEENHLNWILFDIPSLTKSYESLFSVQKEEVQTHRM